LVSRFKGLVEFQR